MYDVGFDFWARGGRIEVKTALPTYELFHTGGKPPWVGKRWQFRMTTEKQTESEFFVCVVLEDLDKYPRGYFVFPAEVMASFGKRVPFAVWESDITGQYRRRRKTMYHQYFNNWGPLLDSIRSIEEEGRSSLANVKGWLYE